MELWHDFATNNKKVMHKWSHYFSIYERHFAAWQGKSLTFLEIGVANGGSTHMWQRYFGPRARIVGIDIDPRCKQNEHYNVNIRTGDQRNTNFLQSIIDEFGVPDIVLDDGSHIMHDIRTSFEFFYPKMGKNAVYMIEDLQVAYYNPIYGGGLESPDNFFNVSKNHIDQMHYKFNGLSAGIVDNTFNISYYPYIICYEKWEPVIEEIYSGIDGFLGAAGIYF